MTIGHNYDHSIRDKLNQQVDEYLKKGGKIRKAEREMLYLQSSLYQHYRHIATDSTVTEYKIVEVARDIEKQFGRQGAEALAASLNRRGYRLMSGRTFQPRHTARMFGLRRVS